MVRRIANEAIGDQVDESVGQPAGLERNLDNVCRGGSTWAIVNMHIATSGQSGQLLLFCPSGQHGMSPDMADISLISPTGSGLAAAGVTSGAATSPTITKTASRRPMSRRRFMAHHHTGGGTWEGSSTSHIRQPTAEDGKRCRNLIWLTVIRRRQLTSSAPIARMKVCRPPAPKRTTSYG